MPTKAASCLLLCLCASLASAQSLGDLARKERERREKNRNEGVEARQISEKEIFGEDEEATEGDTAAGEDETRPGSGAASSIVDVDVSPESAAGEKDARDRKQQEAEWRAKFRDARARVAAAREQQQVVDGIHFVPGMTYVDEDGNTVVESLEQLRQLVGETAREVSEAEGALARLEEEARRAGVPPGWLR